MNLKGNSEVSTSTNADIKKELEILDINEAQILPKGSNFEFQELLNACRKVIRNIEEEEKDYEGQFFMKHTCM